MASPDQLRGTSSKSIRGRRRALREEESTGSKQLVMSSRRMKWWRVFFVANMATRRYICRDRAKQIRLGTDLKGGIGAAIVKFQGDEEHGTETGNQGEAKHGKEGTPWQAGKFARAIEQKRGQDYDIQEEPDDVDRALDARRRKHEGKDDLPGNIRAQGKHGHAIGSLAEAMHDDKDVDQCPEDAAAKHKQCCHTKNPFDVM